MQRVEATDYRDIAQASDPQLSPDGERVAFVRTVPDDGESYEATVHVVPVGGDGASQFTVAEGIDSEPRYSPSGEPAHVVDRLERLVRWFDGYSSHHDVPRATERGDEGLSGGRGRRRGVSRGPNGDGATTGEPPPAPGCVSARRAGH